MNTFTYPAVPIKKEVNKKEVIPAGMDAANASSEYRLKKSVRKLHHSSGAHAQYKGQAYSKNLFVFSVHYYDVLYFFMLLKRRFEYHLIMYCANNKGY